MKEIQTTELAIQESWNNASAQLGPALAPEWFVGDPGAASKRTLANHRNSQLSTGPRGAPGKAVSSMNATRHGLSSTKLLIPGESAAELEQFEAEQRQRLCPRNGLEEELVEQYTHSKWRMRRLEKLEGTLLSHHFWRPDSEKDTEGVLGQLDHLTRYEAGLRRTMFRCLDLINSSRKSGSFPDASGLIIDTKTEPGPGNGQATPSDIQTNQEVASPEPTPSPATSGESNEQGNLKV